MNTQVTISVIAGPAATAASSWSSAQCGSNLTVTLTGNTPAPGGSGVFPVTITSPTFPTTTATGLNTGSYTFTWTVTSGCGGGAQSAFTTAIVNCPTQYLVAAPRYISEYNINTVLAQLTTA